MISDDSSGEAGRAIARLTAPWALARVSGPSMAPAVRSGDRLLVRRVAPKARLRPGTVVLARFPSRPELLVVKRIVRAADGGHWVEGDNAFVTDDSRAFGVAVVVGRVVGRLWPRPGRIGRAQPRSWA